MPPDAMLHIKETCNWRRFMQPTAIACGDMIAIHELSERTSRPIGIRWMCQDTT